MNAGPSGFAHAPVSKGLVLAAVGCTVVSNAARASHRRLPRPLVLASRSLAFGSPAELLFGCLLLYYLRVLERQTGSGQYAARALAVTGLSLALQAALGGTLRVRVLPPPPGPLPLIFSSVVPFLCDIPATSTFSVLGCTMSDKAFVYLAGLQLVLTSGRRSLLVFAASALAGVLYRANFLGVKRLRIPAPVVRLASKLLGPLLADQSGPSIMLVSNGPPGQHQGFGPAGGHGHHHGMPGGPRPAAAAGPAAAGAPGRAAAAPPSREALEMLLSMGFSRERATQALQQANGDVQAAIALLVGA